MGDEAGDEVGEEAEDHDETNRSLSRFGASRSANSSAAHSIAASPVHAIPSRSVRPCHDHAIPSLDDDLPSVLRAHPGDDASDVYERWCDYGPELMRGRPYRPQMPTKPPPLDVARQPNLLALEARSLAGEYVGERNAAGQCEGRGKYVFAEGAVFEGEFKAGKPEGRIIYRSADGDVYEGDFKAGQKDGRGIYWSASGAVYEGEFKAGKPEGRGIYWFADGDVQEGEFKAGKPEGRGIYWFADGDVYKGEFKADKRDHDETNRSLNRSLGASPFRKLLSCPFHCRLSIPCHSIPVDMGWAHRMSGRPSAADGRPCQVHDEGFGQANERAGL